MDGFELKAMHKRGMTPDGHVLRTGSGVRIGEAGEHPDGDHPANVGGFAAEMRIEADRHVVAALRAQENPDRGNRYNVWDVDIWGNEYLADVRERLPDGTSRSLLRPQPT